MQKVIEFFTGDYKFLSNFYPCPVEFEGYKYPSVENAYQAAKTWNVEDKVMFLTCTAGQAKRWGSPKGRIKIQENWEDMKYGIMRHLVRKKFKEYPFRLALLSTGDARLEEGNWWGDRVWGKMDGIGKNWLGEILMDVRAEIQNEEVLSGKGSQASLSGSGGNRAPGTDNPRQKGKAKKAQKLGKKELARRIDYASMH